MVKEEQEQKKQKVSLGRIVHYTLTAAQAAEAKKQRGVVGGAAVGQRTIEEGNVCPMIITAVWNAENGTVNGQAFLDGNDSLWVTSVDEGAGPGKWCWPPRV